MDSNTRCKRCNSNQINHLDKYEMVQNVLPVHGVMEKEKSLSSLPRLTFCALDPWIPNIQSLRVLMRNELSKVLKVAAELRKLILEEIAQDTLTGYCAESSQALKQVLKTLHDIEVQVVYGVLGEPKKLRGHVYNVFHGLVVDLTVSSHGLVVVTFPSSSYPDIPESKLNRMYSERFNTSELFPDKHIDVKWAQPFVEKYLGGE